MVVSFKKGKFVKQFFQYSGWLIKYCLHSHNYGVREGWVLGCPWPHFCKPFLSKQPTIFSWQKRHDNILATKATVETPHFLKFLGFKFNWKCLSNPNNLFVFYLFYLTNMDTSTMISQKNQDEWQVSLHTVTYVHKFSKRPSNRAIGTLSL